MVSFFITVVKILSCYKKCSHVDIILLENASNVCLMTYILERMIILYLNCWYIITSNSKGHIKWNISIYVFKYRGTVCQNTYMNWELYERKIKHYRTHFYRKFVLFSCFVIFWNVWKQHSVKLHILKRGFHKKNTIINYKALNIRNFFLTLVKLVTVFIAGMWIITDARTPG